MPRTLAPLASKLGCAFARCIGSHTIDVHGLDDRPPLLDFRFLQRRQSFGLLLLGREDLLSDIGKALAHGWIGERFDGGLIELADDFSSEFRTAFLLGVRSGESRATQAVPQPSAR
jgi:hypothetical protein